MAAKEFVNVYKIGLKIDKECEIYDAKITSAEKATEIINVVFELNQEAVEKLGVITLTDDYKVAGLHVIAVGSKNCAYVEEKDMFVPAMLNNSELIILFHNHPSGNPRPSFQDVVLTEESVKFGDRYGIKVFDHIIVADDKYHSMRDNKNVDFTKKIIKSKYDKLFE